MDQSDKPTRIALGILVGICVWAVVVCLIIAFIVWVVPT